MGPLLGRSVACEKAFYGAFPPCPELCNGWARAWDLHNADGSDLRAGTFI
jgi:hypothetical protein